MIQLSCILDKYAGKVLTRIYSGSRMRSCTMQHLIFLHYMMQALDIQSCTFSPSLYFLPGKMFGQKLSLSCFVHLVLQ